MGISEWANMHEAKEKAFISQCFKCVNGTNGDRRPDPPPGMSRAKATVLFFHTKALNNGQTGRRKMEESKPMSLRVAEALKKELAFEAAELDISLSEYLIRCINIGRPIVMAYPALSVQFEKPCLQR